VFLCKDLLYILDCQYYCVYKKKRVFVKMYVYILLERVKFFNELYILLRIKSVKKHSFSLISRRIGL
jgi:hypothetical protein